MTHLEPRRHQQDALAALQRTFARHDRAQLVMACGTGKTLIGRWHAEQIDAELTLVVVPSLSLVAQTLAEWRSATGWEFEPLVVCSDQSTAQGAAERATGGSDVDAPVWASHRARVTTDPSVATRFLRPRRHPRVVFSTYHSAPVVQVAAAAAGVTFDLVIADEAHRLTGRPREEFRVVLDDVAIPARQRLFMTATPVHTGVAASPDDEAWSASLTMDDEAVFGPVAHRLGFSAAIAAGLLADYEVLVFDPAAAGAQGPTAAVQVAAAHGSTRLLTFHGRVQKAESFAGAVDGLQLPDGRRVRAHTVRGTDSAVTRARVLHELGTTVAGQLTVVTNARCLSEGVDVPAIDGVLFADPKTSEVDVIQAVGRAMRPAPGKRRGLILVPVDAEGLDTETALATSCFAPVWRVLSALRSLDDRLADFLEHAPRGRRGPTGRRRPHRSIPRVLFQLPAAVDLVELNARLVDASGSEWDRFYEELAAHTVERGRVDLPRASRLGLWAERQRQAHRRRLLPTDRAQRLTELPGWVWDHEQARWEEQLEQVRRLTERHRVLPLREAAVMDIELTTRRQRDQVRTVGQWCAAQRIAHRRGELTSSRQAQCQRLPGWRWQALGATDATAVDLLGEYAAWKGEANPPVDYVDDDVALGRWLNGVRRQKMTGHLPQPLLDELAVLTPSSGPGQLQWNTRDTLWGVSYAALVAFVRREGHCRVPGGHHEVLADVTIALANWTRNQRHQRRQDELSVERATLLERIPGWCWEVPRAARVLMDLGDQRHGTRAGYAKGCTCSDCTEANRVDHANRDALRRQGLPATDWVNAARARGHLRVLCGQGAELKVLARATGLNTKTVTQLVDGTTERILPTTEAAVLGVAMRHVRGAALPGSRVDAATTWRLLEHMIAQGWPKSWLSRELGQDGRALQLSRHTVTATNARQVELLAEQLTGLTPPRRRHRQSLPTLAELLATTRSDVA